MAATARFLPDRLERIITAAEEGKLSDVLYSRNAYPQSIRLTGSKDGILHAAGRWRLPRRCC